MKLLGYFYDLIDWKKNIKYNGKIDFQLSFCNEVSKSKLKKSLFQLIKEEVKYFEIDENNFLTEESFFKNPFNDFEFSSISKKSLISDVNIYNGAISLIFTNQNINQKQIQELVCFKELYLATLGELNYMSWQEKFGLSFYKYRKGLKIIESPRWGEIVDIKTRPGRSFGCKFFYFYGASQLWFGPRIYQYIPQQLILDFKGAIEIKVLENNVTFVHLYDGIYDGFAPHNQEVQRRFREHIKIDSLNID